MKKTIFGIFAVIIISISFFSCSANPEGYEEQAAQAISRAFPECDCDECRKLQGSTYQDSVHMQTKILFAIPDGGSDIPFGFRESGH